MKLDKRTFWDSDIENLDFQLDESFIIHRIITRGTDEEFKAIFKNYSKFDFIEAVSHKNKVSKKTLNFISVIFNIDTSNISLCSYTGNIQYNEGSLDSKLANSDLKN